ncbi:MAG: single-stranded-DNA-specific exonuclease RecJ [Firmicutes bacterium]|nr:single-stranded-DNA-specific exonuclease RecJ [Bacillota bacterium]MCL5040302.1 single-stranded-DNA-specific exonuclease RecJ [Bacillota bacterium]
MPKRWLFQEADPEAVARLAAELGVSPLLAGVLCRRGLQDPVAAREFLSAGLEGLLDPFRMPDMGAAVQRIRQALERQEKILVYGDYDVDGVTAVSLLVIALRHLGATVEYHLPLRLEEGYGLNSDAIRAAGAGGIRLIITVDCGISSFREVEYAKELGLEVIITDHHEPPAILPPALAILNPKRPDSEYPFRELAGVGVAFKLAWALGQDHHATKESRVASRDLMTQTTRGGTLSPLPDWLSNLLDLVALGTVADVVPLLGENRILVREGLTRLSQGLRPGIRALLEVTGLAGKTVTAGQVGFVLGPRVNAGGRLGDAARGVELLLSPDYEAALPLARELDEENKRRRAVEDEILQEAVALVEAEVDLEREWGLVLASHRWHPGVIGIVASRLVERFHRPTFLVALEKGSGKGSGRSISGFPLHEALAATGDLLQRYGGHEQAGGFSIDPANLAAFRERFGLFCRERLSPADLVPTLAVEEVLTLEAITLEVTADLGKMAPHGPGNPIPLFALAGMKVVQSRTVGKEDRHLRLKLQEKSGRTVWVVGFGLGHLLSRFFPGQLVDVALQLERGIWNGEERVELHLKDFRVPGEEDGGARKEQGGLPDSGWGRLEVAATRATDPFQAKTRFRPGQKTGPVTIIHLYPTYLDLVRGWYRLLSPEQGAGIRDAGDSDLLGAGGRIGAKGDLNLAAAGIGVSGDFHPMMASPRLGAISGLHWPQTQKSFLTMLTEFNIILTTVEFLLYHLDKQGRPFLPELELIWQGVRPGEDQERLNLAGWHLAAGVRSKGLPFSPGLKIIDRRGEGLKGDYLALLARRGKTLVYLADPGLLPELPGDFWPTGLREDLYYFLLGPSGEGRRWAGGSFPFSGTSLELPPAGPGVSDVVFLSLPHSAGEFLGGLQGLSPGTRVHLLYGPDDMILARRRIDLMAPERDFLADLYRSVKGIFSSLKGELHPSPTARPLFSPGVETGLRPETLGGAQLGVAARYSPGGEEPDWPGEVDGGRKQSFLGLADRLRGHPDLRGVPRGAIVAGLLVLWELGILSEEREVLSFRPPRSKLDLTTSLRYREGMKQRRELETVAGFLLESSREEIAQRICFSVPSS